MLVGAEKLSQLSSLAVNHLIVHGLFTVCTELLATGRGKERINFNLGLAG